MLSLNNNYFALDYTILVDIFILLLDLFILEIFVPPKDNDFSIEVLIRECAIIDTHDSVLLGTSFLKVGNCSTIKKMLTKRVFIPMFLFSFQSIIMC